MNSSKILAFLDTKPCTEEEVVAHFGPESLGILLELNGEGSLRKTNNLYEVVHGCFTGSILSYQCSEPVHYIDRCHSTNDVAEKLARNGWTGVVTTDFQERGRGRIGRVWQSSPQQNLLFSVVLRPDIEVAQAARTSLVLSAEIADELGLFVKWPNDIIDSQDRKVGGVLSSMQIKENRVEFIIFGVGLNVNQEYFQDLPQATSLRILNQAKQNRNELLKKIIRRVRNTDPNKDFSLWTKLSRTLNREVKIGLVQGLATSIREDGALIVGGIPVLTGDVQLMEGGQDAFGG